MTSERTQLASSTRMFTIHITPSLQKDLGIFDKDKTTLSLNTIIETAGINSGLSIAIRRNLPSFMTENILLEVKRIDEDKNLGWFRVAQISQANGELLDLPDITVHDDFRTNPLSIPCRTPEDSLHSYTNTLVCKSAVMVKKSEIGDFDDDEDGNDEEETSELVLEKAKYNDLAIERDTSDQ